MERTIRQVMSLHFASYAAKQRMPGYVHRAARQLQRCRTAAMGGHLQACPQGHFERRIFHSCRHRLCPQCNALPREQWLLRMRERLIECPHHHLIFTIPHDLHGLWRWNRAWLTQALFAAVAATLHELTTDERYLGATPGFISALHTWGRSLSFHPHIHCLISDGGLSSEARWQRPRRSSFLPVRVVMALFRGKLLDALRTALDNAALRLPPDLSVQRAATLFNRLGRVKWNVHLRERYEHGEGVMIYLARYLKGGALNNRQIVRLDAHEVAFRYTPHHADPARAAATTLSLSATAFVERYLQHTPLPGVPVVRHYGLYACAKRALLAQAREQHGQSPPPREAPTLRCITYLEQLSPQHAAQLRCPHCQAALIVRAVLARQQGPPCSVS